MMRIFKTAEISHKNAGFFLHFILFPLLIIRVDISSFIEDAKSPLLVQIEEKANFLGYP